MLLHRLRPADALHRFHGLVEQLMAASFMKYVSHISTGTLRGSTFAISNGCIRMSRCLGQMRIRIRLQFLRRHPRHFRRMMEPFVILLEAAMLVFPAAAARAGVVAPHLGHRTAHRPARSPVHSSPARQSNTPSARGKPPSILPRPSTPVLLSPAISPV